MDPLLLLFIIAMIPSSCCGRDGCSVWVENEHIEVGSSIDFLCNTTCEDGEIFWKINTREVDKSLSQTINSTHALLSLRNFTQPRAMVECCSANDHQSVAGIVIKTYTKPRNISCILHYDSEKAVGVPQLLTCTWEHHMYFPEKVNYAVLLTRSSPTTLIEICTSKVTNCTVKNFYISKHINLFFGDNFTIKVRAQTPAWKAYSDPYDFDPYRIWKINPPEFAVSAFPDHLSVEFIQPHKSEELHCQVKYSKISSPDEQTTERKFSKPTKQKVEIPIKDKLESCSYYSLSLRCGLLNSPWSDWSREKTVLTKLNRSQIRLRLWRKVTEVQSDGFRKVLVMWQDILSTCEGTFTYAIKQAAYTKNTTQEKHVDTVCRNSTCDVNVNGDAHRINVTVSHNEETLIEESVYVPAVGESLPEVTEIQTSARDGVILLSWTAPAQAVRSYMIDWTNDGNQYHWEESEHTNATLFDLLNEKPYDITITPLFEEKTGHGSRVPPICSGVKGPGIVSITNVQVYDKSANVSWDTKSLGSCSGTVVSYTVFYRTQEGPVLNITVDNKTQEAFLKGLDPDTQYTVYVEATALTGTATSRERLFKTKKFDPNLMTVLIVSGTLIIVLVLSLGLCCAVQLKKFKDKPVPNPGLSSVALWPSLDHQKGTCLFSIPSESTYDQVYTTETLNSSHSSLAMSSNSDACSNQSEEYADSAVVQDGKPADPVETRRPSSSQESTALLPPRVSPTSPYRSQTSVETQTSKTGKQCQRGPAREPDKTLLKTVYVTLEMFEHDQQ